MHPPTPSWPDHLPGMVWATSLPLVLGTTFLRLIRALLPLATLWVSQLLLDAVVARITHKSGNLQQIWKLIALELGLAIVSDALGRVNSPLAHRCTSRSAKSSSITCDIAHRALKILALKRLTRFRAGDRIESAADRSLAKIVIGRLSNGYDQMVGRRFEDARRPLRRAFQTSSGRL
jgi:hypothetical protein